MSEFLILINVIEYVSPCLTDLTILTLYYLVYPSYRPRQWLSKIRILSDSLEKQFATKKREVFSPLKISQERNNPRQETKIDIWYGLKLLNLRTMIQDYLIILKVILCESKAEIFIKDCLQSLRKMLANLFQNNDCRLKHRLRLIQPMVFFWQFNEGKRNTSVFVWN